MSFTPILSQISASDLHVEWSKLATAKKYLHTFTIIVLYYSCLLVHCLLSTEEYLFIEFCKKSRAVLFD